MAYFALELTYCIFEHKYYLEVNKVKSYIEEKVKILLRAGGTNERWVIFKGYNA